MDIFISWHGKRSHAVAVALRDWLPQIVNDFKPWLSSSSIDKGARWSPEIATKLATAKAGIFCLTPSNLTAPWILFEAGAISKSTEKTYVCTLLVDLQHSDVTDPLAQFQATKLTRDELLQLVKNLNGVLGEHRMSDAHVEKAFEKWWPDLETELKKLPSDETAPPPQRPERELLEEVLDKVRDLSQRLRPAISYQLSPTPELTMALSGASHGRGVAFGSLDALAHPERMKDIYELSLKTGDTFGKAVSELQPVNPGQQVKDALEALRNAGEGASLLQAAAAAAVKDASERASLLQAAAVEAAKNAAEAVRPLQTETKKGTHAAPDKNEKAKH